MSSPPYPSPWPGRLAWRFLLLAALVRAPHVIMPQQDADMAMWGVQALDIMQGRIEKHYTPGELTWQEVKATVESAYRKGTVYGTTTKVVRWRHGKPILPSQEVTL